MEGSVLDENANREVDGYDTHQLVEGVNRRGAEGAGDVSNHGILGYAKASEKACLACVPDRIGIGENRKDYRCATAPIEDLGSSCQIVVVL